MRSAALLLAACLGLGGCALTAKRVLGPQLAHARAVGAPLLIYALGVPGEIETSRAQVEVPVYIQFVVTAPDPIDNIRFTLTAYSPRGTAVLGHNGGHMSMLLVGPGPFDPAGNYEVNSFHSSPAGFPGGEVACVSLTQIDITFADGQHTTYGPTDLPVTLMPSLRKRCNDRGIQVDNMMGGSH